MQKVINCGLSAEELTLKLNESLDSAHFDIELSTRKFSKPTWISETFNGYDFKKYMTSEEIGEVNELFEKSYQRVSPHGYYVAAVQIVPHNKSIGEFLLPTELFEDDDFSFAEFQALLDKHLLQIQKLFRSEERSIKPSVYGNSSAAVFFEPHYSFRYLRSLLEQKDFKNVESLKKFFGAKKGHWAAFSQSIQIAISAVDAVIEDNAKAYYSLMQYCENEPCIDLKMQDVYVLYDSLYDDATEYNKGWWGRIKANRRRGMSIPLCVEIAHVESDYYKSVYVPSHLLLAFEFGGASYLYIKESDLKSVVVPYQGVLDRLNDEGVKI